MPKEEIQRPGTAKPVANVILPSGEVDGDDDDNFVVEESKPAMAVEDDAVSRGLETIQQVSETAYFTPNHGKSCNFFLQFLPLLPVTI